jgi:hypothetical protein
MLSRRKLPKKESPTDGCPASYTYAIPILLIEKVEFKDQGAKVGSWPSSAMFPSRLFSILVY